MSIKQVIQTRHVLAVNNLDAATRYFMDVLEFDRDFSAPGWEFLSFGDFKLMIGHCADAPTAVETGDHSYFAHVLVENVDSVFEKFYANGAQLLSHVGDRPWGIRDFAVKTPEGHRITFGQLIANK